MGKKCINAKCQKKKLNYDKIVQKIEILKKKKKNFVYIAILNVLAMRQNYALILLSIS